MGDSVLVEFGSAVDPVRNALTVQDGMRQHNAGLSEPDKISFRVGINVGDIIADGSDIHGDGVNVATLLDGLCEPGDVYDQIEGRLASEFDNLGKYTVKNIAKPVRVFRVRHSTAKSVRVSAPERPHVHQDNPAVAVPTGRDRADDGLGAVAHLAAGVDHFDVTKPAFAPETLVHDPPPAQGPIVHDRVRYIGDIVAMVVAPRLAAEPHGDVDRGRDGRWVLHG